MPQVAESGRALVVGYGSAGARHARALRELGLDVAAVSRRPLEELSAFRDLGEAVSRQRPGYVVVANETARHRATLEQLAACGYSGNVLVEKPLFHDAGPMPANGFARVSVGYQLRFRPLLQRLRERLSGVTPVSAQIYVGQHLPQWRPDRRYQDSYSARADQGGGALRDLSHEIDLALWLFGGWTRVTALGGNHGALEVDSDDCFTLLLETPRCPAVTVQMNYLDRQRRREILVNAKEATLRADLVDNLLEVDAESERFEGDPFQSTLDMHRAALDGDMVLLCDLAQGSAVMQVICGAEAAAARRSWIAA